MKQAKRIAVALLAVVMLMGIATACTSGDPSTSGSSSSTDAQTSSSSGSSSDNVSTDPIRIAYIAPMTGDFSQYGITMKRGIDLKVKEFNEAGGYNGQKIEIVVYDDKNDQKETVSIANLILGEEDIWCVMGPFSSGCSMAISPLLQKAEVIHFALQASHADATKAGEWIFRGSSTMHHIQSYFADFFANYLEDTKIAVLYSNNEWGNSTYASFEEHMLNAGGEIVAAENFIEGQTQDFSPLISKLKAANPDAIFLLCMYNDTASALKQMRNLEVDCDIMITTANVKQELLDLVGADGEGVYAMSPFLVNDPRPIFTDFAARFAAEYGADQGFDAFVTDCYDAMGIVCEGIKQFGPDKYKVREYMANLKDYEGVSGTFGFDETRSPTKPCFPLVIQDGKFVLIEA